METDGTGEAKRKDGEKTCLNPGCGKPFLAGHYGTLQKICGAAACKKWYKGYWSQTRHPPRGIPDRDFGRIAAALKRADVRHWALVIVARESGLRKGELLGLNVSDLFGEDGKPRRTFSIRGQWSDTDGFKDTKTESGRMAILTAKARRALAEAGVPEGADRAARYWAISEARAWELVNEAQRELGIANPKTGRPYRFHDFRHSIGTELVAIGRLDLAQKVLGHKNVNTTMQYSEREPEEILEDVERVRRKPAKRRKMKRPRAKIVRGRRKKAR